jgi:endonuclease G, mitochondrial
MISFESEIKASAARAEAANLEGVIRRLSQTETRVATRRQVEQRRATLNRQIDDPEVVASRIERILNGNDLTDISYLLRGAACSRSVGRVVIRRKGKLIGYGTGFLVAPQVMLTNHHVLSSIEEVRESRIQFGYERDMRGIEQKEVEFQLSVTPRPILFRELDIAFVSVEPTSTDQQPLSRFGWLPLNGKAGKAFVGEYLTIIQHPKGEYKQICVRENRLLKYLENSPYLWYMSDTTPGSSGSPVFNNSWEVVALHHSSVPRTKTDPQGRTVWLSRDGKPWTTDMGEDAVDWFANEGVRISRILIHEHHDHAFTSALINVPPQPLTECSTAGEAGATGIEVDRANGRTRIVVPIAIEVSTGIDGVHLNTVSTTRDDASSNDLPRAPLPIRPPLTIEKIEIDQDNYDERDGFRTDFLGDNFIVPLPRVARPKASQVLKVGSSYIWKYWTYSVVMNKQRGLAFFSAANVDIENFKGKRDSDGDRWFVDTRISERFPDVQVDQSFYKKQKTFEADRSLNPFDQGHLTRRKDAQWGESSRTAKRNGDDSYHYTNCAPQHWQFNQNSAVDGIWFRLEEAAVSQLTGVKRICVINGPIFDAPLASPADGGRLRPNLRGRRVKDGIFGELKIPKQFFKVIAYVSEGDLTARAFVVSQESLLSTVDRFYPEEAFAERTWLSDLEVQLYEVSIADLEYATNLNFGRLRKLNGHAEERIIIREADLRF